MSEEILSPWEKLTRLIEVAKAADRESDDPRGGEPGRTLRSGTPQEVVEVLKAHDITMDDLGEIFADLEVIADRNSLRFWSPLA